jgi:hypothetical protein
VLLDLERADGHLRAEGWPGLLEVLYSACGRIPRNLLAEEEALGRAAAARAMGLAAGRSGAAALFLRDTAGGLERRQGAFYRLACEEGLEWLERELDLLSRSIELAERNDGPVRLANFSRRAAGTTKALRAGSPRYMAVADALLRHLPGLAGRVEAERPADPAARRRLALEFLNIFRNETPVDVLCYGHLVLEKQGRRLDSPARCRELGEPVRLLLLNLRGAEILEARGERVVSIENETTFNDYIEWLNRKGREEIVLLSEGQANWAVLRLLGLIARAAPALRFHHWGDLDRFGVLILRSLRLRSGIPIEPLWMDVPTFERFLGEGTPLEADEKREIDADLAASPDGIGAGLLRAIRDSGLRVEQEAVAEGVLDL